MAYTLITPTKYMKILSDSEYQALLNKSNSGEINDLKKLHREEIESKDRTIKNLKEDHTIAITRKEAEQDLILQKATKELNAKVQTLTLEKNNATKEVEILTKAFENLGFDVKDMKEILNKLVDGIVSKNQIQLVK